MANNDAEEKTTENISEDKEEIKAETKATEQAKKSKKQSSDDKGQETQEVAADKSYQGTVKIIIQAPINLPQLGNLTDFLNSIPESRIVLSGGSVREGNKIIIACEQPTPLLQLLSECSAIDELGTRGRDIMVTLKSE